MRELSEVAVIRLAWFLLLAASAWAQSLDGVWLSEGYGNVYQIRGATLKAFEVTTRTCVPAFTAKRVGAASFKIHRGESFDISNGPDEDHKLLQYSDALARIRIDRIARMPSVCDVPTANTPINNFDVLAGTFAEQYISFDLRGLDWAKIISENRAKITPRTTPAELFEVFNSMLKPLGDLHVSIEAPRLKRESQPFFRAGTDRLIKGGVDNFVAKGRPALFAITDRAWLHSPLRKFCNGHLQYGHVDASTGYLRILSFGGYAKHGPDLPALESALDKILSDPALKALVIDVRLAFGGDDRLGVAIASRLTNVEYLAYSIQARADPMDRGRWTAADDIRVRPSSRTKFLGPVVVLIGGVTMSGAETFVQALMGRTSHVTLIGENTQGVFCDAMERHLPNGWTFSLPNAVYRTTAGVAFDVRGIPPDIHAPVYADDDITGGRDPAMGRAVEILQKVK